MRKLAELAESISRGSAANWVRKITDGKYELVVGERRLGLSELKAPKVPAG